MTTADHERIRVLLPLLIGSAGGWLLLSMSPEHMAMHPDSTVHVSAGLQAWESSWLSHGELSGLMLMLAAMMLPLLRGPILHVQSRTLARRRGRSIGAFLTGYFAIWFGVGSMLLTLTHSTEQLASPFLIFCAFAGAIIWQCSPFKQRCLNRCHHLPEIATFDLQADRDAAWFGATHAAWCVGSCWLMMLLPMVVGAGHFPVMVMVSAWMVAERVERPAERRWQVRVPMKAARIFAFRMGAILA